MQNDIIYRLLLRSHLINFGRLKPQLFIIGVYTL